jgi:Transcriptional regulator containing an amidase domain and an AraC-type DNA-binding HTH domain
MSLVLERQDYLLGQAFPLRVLRRSPQPPFDRHGHEFGELVIVLSGRATHLINNESYAIGPGDAFVVHVGDEHEFADLEELCLVNLLFDPELADAALSAREELPGYRALFLLEPELRQSERSPSHLRLSLDEIERANGIVAAIERELEASEPGSADMCRALFSQLAIFLSRCYGRLPQGDAQAMLRLARALDYLERHFTEGFDLAELAGKENMSARNLQRLFASVVGESPREYQLSLRMKMAQRLLRETDRSITDIAFACGFEDSNYFARYFKKRFGLSPLEWKRTK